MDEIKTYLTFKVGTEYYACKVSYIQNILEYSDNITRLPKMHENMLGIIDLRGIVLPVIDLARMIGSNKSKITANTCVLVMEIKSGELTILVGVLVDEVDEVIEIKNSVIKATPGIGKTSKNEFVEGVYQHNDRFILISNMSKVLEINEFIEIENLSEVV